MAVSKNMGSPILIGFSLINHPFWGTTIFGNTQMITVDGSENPANHMLSIKKPYGL